MQKTSFIQFRANQELKQDAEKVLKELGLTTAQAITMFLVQVVRKKGIPFKISLSSEIEQLNAETEKKLGMVLKEFAKGKGKTLRTAQEIDNFVDSI